VARRKAGRAVAGAARSVQQPQFRQVQGLQRHSPPLLQAQAAFVFSVMVMVILLSFALWRNRL